MSTQTGALIGATAVKETMQRLSAFELAKQAKAKSEDNAHRIQFTGKVVDGVLMLTAPVAALAGCKPSKITEKTDEKTGKVTTSGGKLGFMADPIKFQHGDDYYSLIVGWVGLRATDEL